MSTVLQVQAGRGTGELWHGVHGDSDDGAAMGPLRMKRTRAAHSHTQAFKIKLPTNGLTHVSQRGRSGRCFKATGISSGALFSANPRVYTSIGDYTEHPASASLHATGGLLA